MRSQWLKHGRLTEPPLEVSTFLQRCEVRTRIESRSEFCNAFSLLDWRAQNREDAESHDGHRLEDGSHVWKIGWQEETWSSREDAVKYGDVEVRAGASLLRILLAFIYKRARSSAVHISDQHAQNRAVQPQMVPPTCILISHLVRPNSEYINLFCTH